MCTHVHIQTLVGTFQRNSNGQRVCPVSKRSGPPGIPPIPPFSACSEVAWVRAKQHAHLPSDRTECFLASRARSQLGLCFEYISEHGWPLSCSSLDYKC
jgi:hypothetical protein